ncbi:MAG: lysylphosphatidylglycerol synthase transmembrane domain-containing protein [Candidatus Woesearchaeota archaeon]
MKYFFKNFLKIFFSFLISAIFLYFIFKIIKLEDLKVVFKLPFFLLIFCFSLYFLSNVLRALRFKLFLEMNFFDISAMTFMHNMINNIVPLRIGELSILFLSKDKKIKSISSLLYSRIFDILAIISLLFFSFLFYLKNNINEKIVFLTEIFIFVFVVFFVFLLVFFYLKIYEKIYEKIKRYKIFKKINIGFFYKKFLEFKNTISLKKAIIAFVYSFLIWILNFYIADLIIKYLGINLKFYEIVFVFSFTTIVSLLPIHGFLGLGTLETAWGFILVLFNIEKELALISGFVFHIVNIVFFLILGLMGFVYYIIKKN